MLQEDLELVRQRGYAEEHEECTEGVSSMAVPIFNYMGDVIAALSISVASAKMERNYLTYLSGLQKTADSISKHMGYTAKRALAKSGLLAAIMPKNKK